MSGHSDEHLRTVHRKGWGDEGMLSTLTCTYVEALSHGACLQQTLKALACLFVLCSVKL